MLKSYSEFKHELAESRFKDWCRFLQLAARFFAALQIWWNWDSNASGSSAAIKQNVGSPRMWVPAWSLPSDLHILLWDRSLLYTSNALYILHCPKIWVTVCYESPSTGAPSIRASEGRRPPEIDQLASVHMTKSHHSTKSQGKGKLSEELLKSVTFHLREKLKTSFWIINYMFVVIYYEKEFFKKVVSLPRRCRSKIQMLAWDRGSPDCS